MSGYVLFNFLTNNKDEKIEQNYVQLSNDMTVYVQLLDSACPTVGDLDSAYLIVH